VCFKFDYIWDFKGHSVCQRAHRFTIVQAAACEMKRLKKLSCCVSWCICASVIDCIAAQSCTHDTCHTVGCCVDAGGGAGVDARLCTTAGCAGGVYLCSLPWGHSWRMLGHGWGRGCTSGQAGRGGAAFPGACWLCNTMVGGGGIIRLCCCLTAMQ
jgi:hypothetical protein